MSTVLLLLLFTTIIIYTFLIHPLVVSPLSKIPGPKLYAITKWRLALDDFTGSRTRTINTLHQHYGPAVRIGPNEIHFNSLAALRTIYGAGSGYERTTFYRMFDVYNRQNLFTFHSSAAHASRKKLLANAYSKSSVLMKPTHAATVQGKVRQYLDLIAAKVARGEPDEVFTSLHYFSIDTITQFVYGEPRFGATRALVGGGDAGNAHRALLSDILDPSRRRLSWFVVHLTALTRWMYTRVGVLESVLMPVLPMQKPATYTGIRAHALRAWVDFKAAALGDGAGLDVVDGGHGDSIIALLFKHHVSQDGGSLEDLEIASECADHLLAGIDTTADTLMFLVWAVSRPENVKYQRKLVEELQRLPVDFFDESGVPAVEAADKLVYLNAVIKETLRLYAPLPATEPRTLRVDAVIDGYVIPAGTVVGMSPFSLHRNARVYPDPLKFNPDRWLASDVNNDLVEMNKWFWAFSSGARMCIGLHLAMAEMTTLVAAVYRKYTSRVADGFDDTTPAITSRFELFFDEKAPRMKEHECWIDFQEQNSSYS